jgi:hypothetical protein
MSFNECKLYLKKEFLIIGLFKTIDKFLKLDKLDHDLFLVLLVKDCVVILEVWPLDDVSGFIYNALCSVTSEFANWNEEIKDRVF